MTVTVFNIRIDLNKKNLAKTNGWKQWLELEAIPLNLVILCLLVRTLQYRFFIECVHLYVLKYAHFAWLLIKLCVGEVNPPLHLQPPPLPDHVGHLWPRHTSQTQSHLQFLQSRHFLLHAEESSPVVQTTFSLSCLQQTEQICLCDQYLYFSCCTAVHNWFDCLHGIGWWIAHLPKTNTGLVDHW